MKKGRRYIATIEIAVYADSDKQALDILKYLCLKQRNELDNNCQLIQLVEQPFGKLGNRKIEIKP